MLKLVKYSNYCITGAGTLWFLSYVFKKLADPDVVVPCYMPFDTTSTFGYAFTVLFEVGPLIWIGFGHYGADCVVGIYYSQARIQLKIIKYNLEHIFDVKHEGTIVNGGSSRRFRYVDEADDTIRSNFIYQVEKYQNVSQFVTEITTIFNASMSIQFFSSVVCSCLVIYNMSTMDAFSVIFLHMIFVLSLYKTQTFLYCYFGYLVENESDTINTAVYFSDWLSVSPRFRRYIVIAMARWGQPLTPRVSSIVPVSLITFATIVKSAYSLYTFMKSR